MLYGFFFPFLPHCFKGQRKILQHILMLKTNIVCDNILQVIFSKKLEIHTFTYEFYNYKLSNIPHKQIIIIEKTLQDAHKNTHNIHVIHKKKHHKGKTVERRRWLAQIQVALINVGVGFSSNIIIKSLQIVINVWVEEFFFELYFSAKKASVSIYL